MMKPLPKSPVTHHVTHTLGPQHRQGHPVTGTVGKLKLAQAACLGLQSQGSTQTLPAPVQVLLCASLCPCLRGSSGMCSGLLE